MGNEVDDLLESKLAPKPAPGEDTRAFNVTAGIMHVVCDHVIHWPIGALTLVNHEAKSNAADDELLRIASADRLAIVTNEEFTERGIVADPKKLRSRAGPRD